jgi:hypothetical protein
MKKNNHQVIPATKMLKYGLAKGFHPNSKAVTYPPEVNHLNMNNIKMFQLYNILLIKLNLLHHKNKTVRQIVTIKRNMLKLSHHLL